MKKRWWFRIFVGECPVCGHDASYKERVEGTPPANREDRYVYLSGQDTYDHCLEMESI